MYRRDALHPPFTDAKIRHQRFLASSGDADRPATATQGASYRQSRSRPSLTSGFSAKANSSPFLSIAGTRGFVSFGEFRARTFWYPR